MAIFRNIQMSFWTDPKIADDFTPDEKFFYLYLLTNPHTNLCGCYEVSIKQMADETGCTRERIEKMVTRLEEAHKVIVYSKDTREVLLVNWHKFNWTASEKFRIPLRKEIQLVKNADFKGFLMELLEGNDTVSIPYPYPTDTTDTVTDTITDTNTKEILKSKYYPDNEQLDKAFSDYVDHRKQIKKPMSSRAVELAIEKLNKLSGGDTDKAIRIINQSIGQGWQGLFELKENKAEKKVQDIDDFWRRAT